MHLLVMVLAQQFRKQYLYMTVAIDFVCENHKLVLLKINAPLL